MFVDLNELLFRSGGSMRTDLGVLILRVATAGTMLFSHGMGKLHNFTNLAGVFPDPLHLGSSTSLVLAIFAEVVCSVFVMIGLATRLACIPLIITMLVAILVIHAADPWDKKEFAFLYLIPFVTIALVGPGRFSLDNLRKRVSLR